MFAAQIGDLVEITRGCRQQTTEECADTEYNAVDVYGCSCNTDYCNNGLRMTVSVYGTVIPLLAAAILHYMFDTCLS